MNDGIAIYGIYAFYKLAVLASGVAFSYMGFRLFLADKIASAGELTANAGTYGLTLRAAAPGTFFCVMGTILISVSLLVDRGDFEFSESDEKPAIEQVIPDVPPENLR